MSKLPVHILRFLLLLVVACFFSVGISWGLPSKRADAFLFGRHPVWTGAEILSLAPSWSDDALRGADVAAHPLANRNESQSVNSTDQERAAIVRRYRLYSDQPDEMITLRALAQIKPGQFQFDPRLYQYGGLWVYPIGALLKIGSIFHLVRLTPDIAFYLDHPEAFARLYIVMRTYSLLWGVAGAAIMFNLANRLCAGRFVGAIAVINYLLLPAVINGVHEAKPHVAGGVLGLVALDMAIRAVQSGRSRYAVAAGIACGAAASMVLSEWTAIAMLPVMACCMPRDRLRAFAVAIGSTGVVYAILNPYVIIHLLGTRTVLNSNLQNSSAMYQAPPSLNGILHSIGLFVQSGSVIVLVGIAAAVVGAFRKSTVAWLVLAGTVPGLIFFALHATAKPGEYARFALPFAILLVVAAAEAFSRIKNVRRLLIAGLIGCAVMIPQAISYTWHYGRETFDQSTRLIVADRLRELSDAGATTLAIDAEPAPYTLPPVDLFRWKILLLPRGAAMPKDADIRIDPVDFIESNSSNVRYWIRPRLLSTPISWAAKPFRIETPPPRSDGAAPAAGVQH